MAWTPDFGDEHEYTPAGPDDTITWTGVPAGGAADDDDYFFIVMVQGQAGDGSEDYISDLTLESSSGGGSGGSLTEILRHKMVSDFGGGAFPYLINQVFVGRNIDFVTPLPIVAGLADLTSLATYNGGGYSGLLHLLCFVFYSPSLPIGNILDYIQGGFEQTDDDTISSDDPADTPDEPALRIDNTHDSAYASFVMRIQAVNSSISGQPPHVPVHTYNVWDDQTAPWTTQSRIVVAGWTSVMGGGEGSAASVALAKLNTGAQTALTLTVIQVSETAFAQQFLPFFEDDAEGETATKQPLLVAGAQPSPVTDEFVTAAFVTNAAVTGNRIYGI